MLRADYEGASHFSEYIIRQLSQVANYPRYLLSGHFGQVFEHRSEVDEARAFSQSTRCRLERAIMLLLFAFSVRLPGTPIHRLLIEFHDVVLTYSSPCSTNVARAGCILGQEGH